jgi:PAS domain-containing protein
MTTNNPSNINPKEFDEKYGSSTNGGGFLNAGFYNLLNKAYDLNSDSIIIYSLRKRLIVGVNDKFLETFQYSKDDVVKCRKFAFDLFIDESEMGYLIDILQEQGFVSNYLVYLRTKAQELRTILFTAKIEIINKQSYIFCELKDGSNN